MLPEYFEFSLPTKLIYGSHILSNIGESIRHFGERKAILVTDQNLEKVAPIEQIVQGFKGTNIQIVCTYDKVPPNSLLHTVEECAEMAKEHDCDMFIAVGGGSVIDTAKVANLLMVKGGNIHDHMGSYLLDDTEQLFPSIFIPTTAGTGSEVTKMALILDSEHNVKLPFAEHQFLPKMAILDPTITVSMPAKLTAITGMDALTHAIEAYVDKEWSPATDALAIHAIKLITKNILIACENPRDLEARGAMQVGSFLAGIAYSHSMVGMVHGISHALGGVYHIPHGLANALVLPEVMEYNLETRVSRYASIARAMGVKQSQVIEGGQSFFRKFNIESFTKILDKARFIDYWLEKKTARAGIIKIRQLNRKIAYLTQMPLNLKEAGITDNLNAINEVVEHAMEDSCMLYNPREPKEEAVYDIVHKLFNQKIDPLPVSEEEFQSLNRQRKHKQNKKSFKDSKSVYNVLAKFINILKEDSEINQALLKSNLCIQFMLTNPEAQITIDAAGDEVKVIEGDFQGNIELTMTMDADFAHAFWHGEVNILVALTQKKITTRGRLPKGLKLLPILKPAFRKYPEFLEQEGYSHLILN
ncbi:MAG: alcohol dehydrogenase [bacterium]|jgi:alcohol dehydrogenase